MASAKVAKSTIYYPDRAPLRITVEVDLQTSPRDVWDTIVDYESWVQWFPGMIACSESSAGPHGGGSKIGSMRHAELGGLIAEEEIIAWDCDPNDDTKSKVWAFTVCETNHPAIAQCWVERLVLEPIYSNFGKGTDDGATIVGTRVRYAAGIDLVWYARLLLQPILVRSIRQSWQVGLKNIDSYVTKKNNAREVTSNK
jgi:hypothetical protein